LLVHVNADQWKSEYHQGLAMPATEPLAITLYDAASMTEHDDFCQQFTAERQIEKWFEGRGELRAWERVERQNHQLDAGYNATAAGHFIFTRRQQPTAPTVAEWVARRMSR
jgi:hypothetical protein